LNPRSLVLVSVSDSGGIGSEAADAVQGAHLVMACDQGIQKGTVARASVLAWRSSRCKRVMSSSLAAETDALSKATAEVEWLQILLRDAVWFDINVRDWSRSLHPYLSFCPEQGELRKVQKVLHQHAVDAKSIYDALQSHSPGSRQCRRSALELALVRSRFSELGSIIRWIPHPLMPVDSLTKADWGKGNAALEHLLRYGRFCLSSEDLELGGRVGRSKRASERHLQSVHHRSADRSEST